MRIIIVAHHVVVDGIGGLAALGALADESPGTVSDRSFPLPAPSVRALAVDAADAGACHPSGVTAANCSPGVRSPQSMQVTRDRLPCTFGSPDDGPADAR